MFDLKTLKSKIDEVDVDPKAILGNEGDLLEWTCNGKTYVLYWPTQKTKAKLLGEYLESQYKLLKEIKKEVSAQLYRELENGIKNGLRSGVVMLAEWLQTEDGICCLMSALLKDKDGDKTISKEEVLSFLVNDEEGEDGTKFSELVLLTIARLLHCYVPGLKKTVLLDMFRSYYENTTNQ